MASVKTWRSPVLLIHGDDDRNVNFSETVTLANALRQQGVYFEQLILPDEIHDFLRHASWLRGYHAAADFLRRKL
jgi:dipeptidyl aminopeptidase/acylaminoacyl peptidase